MTSWFGMLRHRAEVIVATNGAAGAIVPDPSRGIVPTALRREIRVLDDLAAYVSMISAPR